MLTKPLVLTVLFELLLGVAAYKVQDTPVISLIYVACMIVVAILYFWSRARKSYGLLASVCTAMFIFDTAVQLIRMH